MRYEKDPVNRQDLLSSIVWLDRTYVGRARAFFALSDLELDFLVFIECCITFCLYFRVVDKQIIAAIIG